MRVILQATAFAIIVGGGFALLVAIIPFDMSYETKVITGAFGVAAMLVGMVAGFFIDMWRD